jgi:peptidyl-prolyl cis-trans isomerase B (cyclophilin B)
LGTLVVDDLASGELERQDRRAKFKYYARWAFLLIVVVAAVIYHFATRTTSSAGSTPSRPPSGESSQPESPQTTNGGLPPFTPPTNLGANCTYPADSMPASKPVKPPKTGKVPTDPGTVTMSMTTNAGNIGLQLDNAKSACTVNSFASLAQQG